MTYTNEVRKLKELVSEDTWDLMKECNAIIAGGAITSVFCNRDVNDLDVYFRTPRDYVKFIYHIFEGEYKFACVALNKTNRSVLLTDKETKQPVQLIVYKFFEDEQAVFNDFDFICNMGALVFTDECEEIILHNDFLKHNSQRYLGFNANTAYPLISCLRVQKYIDKGYTISKAQMLRVLLAVNKKDISSWETLKDEVGGMYGLNMNDVFPETEEFSMDKALETLDEIFSDGKFKVDKTFPELTTLFEIVEDHFADKDDKRVDCSDIYFKNARQLPDGKIVSYYDSSFEYVVGQSVDGGKNGIYCAKGYRVLSATWGQMSDGVILELKGTSKNTNPTPYPWYTMEDNLFGPVEVVAAYTLAEFKSKYKSDIVDSDMIESIVYYEED